MDVSCGVVIGVIVIVLLLYVDSSDVFFSVMLIVLVFSWRKC